MVTNVQNAYMKCHRRLKRILKQCKRGVSDRIFDFLPQNQIKKKMKSKQQTTLKYQQFSFDQPSFL
ncbi:unnamed protein product [Paramecium sonneborni]|uniref:Uncharacterized protein n=1 Tax=Paramecium sonneborni TaxID=65129 RepID=A0A8S1PLG4_9CILI|nr:unnamed protein product [Paramecium sonneborni]